MKKFTLIIALIAIGLINGFSQNVDLKRGLVAYYPFNGNAIDESGNSNNGSLYGATSTSDRLGNSNSALNFNNSRVTTVFSNSSFYFSDITFSFWFKPSSELNYSSSNSNRKTFISNANGCIQIYYENGKFTVELWKSGHTPNFFSYSTTFSSDWYHVVVSCSEYKDVILYINNQKYVLDNANFTFDKFASKLDFGACWNNSLCFNGKLDEFRLYNRILNINEIQALYNNKSETLKPPVISWITPNTSFVETSDLQYTVKATIQSEKQIKSIKVNSGYSTLTTETYFYLSNGQGIFEKSITLNSGSNEITIIAENEDGSTTSTSKTIKYTEPQVPPMLSVSNINFTDNNNNNRIDGNEKCFINFTIANKGKGSARNLKVLVQNNSSISGLAFSNSTTLGTIAPNATQNVNIPISGTMDLTSGTANIKVSFEESLGFPPDEFELKIETKEFVKPDVKVVDNSFLTDNGTIKLGMPIQLKALIQNVGQGTAENVNVSFSYPSSNVFANGEKDFVIGTMQAGATKELIFEFIANKLLELFT
jgi:hypothetical protein